MTLNTPDTRPASPSGVLNVVPSPAWPASRRATDILPPCVVWKVLSTSASGSLPALTPRRATVSATPGASWRSALSRRSTPFERVATPSSTGHDQALAQFLGEIVEHLVARRLDVLEQLLHQLVVVIGQRLQHGEARFLLAVEVVALELDDLGRRVLLVDKGALEREIDEAGDDVAVPDRNLPQHQRHARGRLQQLERLAHALVGLVDLVEEQKARNVRGLPARAGSIAAAAPSSRRPRRPRPRRRPPAAPRACRG